MTSLFAATGSGVPDWQANNVADSLDSASLSDDAGDEGDYHSAEYGLDGDAERHSGALVVHSHSVLLTNADSDQPQDQLEELLEELGRIETQQDKLRDAVKHNKQIVIHPRQEVLEDTDSEYDSPKAATPKKKILVSGGLTGFGVAQDLLQLDFSTPEEAPEEFRAVPFFEEPRQVRPGLSGSFGICDPASKEMHHYLERLEEQQRLVLELITGKKQALLDSMGQSSGLQAKQGRPARSRLAKSSRLGDGGEKAAVANALGLSPTDKMSSLGANKMGGLSVGKGALAAKLPLMSLGASARTTQQPTRISPRRQGAVAAAAAAQRRAQVQKEEIEAKEQEEMLAQFAKPMPGTTPSTQHLAGKKGKEAIAAAAELPRVAEVAPKELEATPRSVPVVVHAGPSEEAHVPMPQEEKGSPHTATQKTGMFKGLNKGLKKMLKGKSKA